jgi:hypothetical protein
MRAECDVDHSEPAFEIIFRAQGNASDRAAQDSTPGLRSVLRRLFFVFVMCDRMVERCPTAGSSHKHHPCLPINSTTPSIGPFVIIGLANVTLGL